MKLNTRLNLELHDVTDLWTIHSVILNALKEEENFQVHKSYKLSYE